MPLFSRPPLFTTSYRFPPLGLDWASGHLFAGERGRQPAGSQSSFGARSGETEGKDGDTGHTAGIFYPFSTTTALRSQKENSSGSLRHLGHTHFLCTEGPRSAKRTHPRRETLGRLIYFCRRAAQKKEDSRGEDALITNPQTCRFKQEPRLWHEKRVRQTNRKWGGKGIQVGNWRRRDSRVNRVLRERRRQISRVWQRDNRLGANPLSSINKQSNIYHQEGCRLEL